MKNLSPVYTTNGQLEAEMVRIFLESKGINAFIYQESVGHTYGLTLGSLGEVNIMVPEEELQKAMELLQEMDRGKFELAEDEPADQDGDSDIDGN